MQQIIPTSTTSSPDLNIECATHLWSQGHSEQPPSLPSSTHQCLWDAPRVASTYDDLLVDAPDCQAKSRLLAVSCPESGAWLNALPISTLGLCLADDVVRIVVGLRLGIPLCSPHPCCCCGATVEPLGTHGLSCQFSKGRHPQHASLNDLVKRALESAEIPSHLEPMVSIGLMARDLTESQLCHGRVVGFLFGMSHALTPRLLPTHLWLHWGGECGVIF